jgi:CRISPR-associated protein Cas1
MSAWHGNAELRTAQYQASFDPQRSLDLAKSIVYTKIMNCRTLLMRNHRGEERPKALLRALKRDARHVQDARNQGELLGIEGTAAGRYFAAFPRMLRQESGGPAYDFKGRGRRPPPDPVNALLSYGYALLVRAWTVTLAQVGFDPMRGFYHQLRHGRPSLALDMMESFRPLVVDSSVLQVINNREVHRDGFILAAGGCAMKERTRKKFIAAFERRMSQEITHPLFGYRVSYRRLFELQARLLARYLFGELDHYPDFTTR